MNSILIVEPNNANALYLRGKGYYYSNQLSLALTDFEAAYVMDPENSTLEKSITQLKERMNRNKKSVSSDVLATSQTDLPISGNVSTRVGCQITSDGEDDEFGEEEDDVDTDLGGNSEEDIFDFAVISNKLAKRTVNRRHGLT